jgi:signal transduction histidine kinase
MYSAQTRLRPASGVAAYLARDRFIQLFAAAFLAEFVVYAVPLLPPPRLAEFGVAPFMLPFVGIAVMAAFEGLHRLGHRNERLFWRFVGAGFGVWLATLSGVAALHASEWTVVRKVLTDAAYMLFYAPLLMGLEYRPHVPAVQLPRQIEISRLLRWAGLTCLVLSWFAYFVAIPVWFDQAFYETMLPSSLLFMLADGYLVIRFAMAGVATPDRRWRFIYGGLAAGALALLGTDALDAAGYAGLLSLPDGALTDLIWVAPIAVFVAAFRLREAPLVGANGHAAERDEARDLEPERAGSLLVSAAASFPVVHIVLQSVTQLARPLQQAQDSAALLGMLLMAGLAAVAYYVLERDRSAAEQAHEAMEGRLREASTLAAVSRLAAATSRELGSALMTARVGVERAHDGLPPSHPDRDTLTQASRALESVQAFTHTLRAIGRQLPIHPARHGLNESVLDLAPAVRDGAGPRVTLDLRLGPSAGTVLVDGAALRQVLLTLADHARRAMPDGGTFTVETDHVELKEREAVSRAARPGRYGRVRVSDTGREISRETLMHLFEPFFAVSDGAYGPGLSLAAAHALVSQHGGILSASSAAGRGTTFEILLPSA